MKPFSGPGSINIETLVGKRVVVESMGSVDRDGVLVKTPAGVKGAQYGVAYRTELISPIRKPVIAFYNIYDPSNAFLRRDNEPYTIVAKMCDGGACYDTIYPSEVSTVEQMLRNNGL